MSQRDDIRRALQEAGDTQKMVTEGAKVSLQFWIVYHTGKYEAGQPLVKPFVVDVYTDESRARAAANKQRELGYQKVDLWVPKIY